MTENRRPVALFVVAVLGFVVFLLAVGAYGYFFRRQELVADPAAWGQFGDYLTGTAGPLIALLALIGLLWTIVINERELRYTREELQLSRAALEQNNEINRQRAKREQLEAQKADIYRIIQPVVQDIETALDLELAVPTKQQLLSGRTIHFGGTRYIVRDLFRDQALIEHRHFVADRNRDTLQILADHISALEIYLRAYERLAGDDFFTGYYKPRFQQVVTLLYQRRHIRSERQQDVLDYFQSGIDVLTSAESSIAAIGQLSGSMSIRFRASGNLTATGTLDTLVIKEAKTDEPRELPYVSVHTYPKPNDPTVRLAIVTWAYASAPVGGVPPNSDAIEKEPMSHEDAMERGKAIATRYGFPRLYWRKDP